MTATKFDETDRRAVVRALCNQLGIRLSAVGRRRKWLRDEAGRSYWVLGGYGNWHGVPTDMMDAETENPSGGLLVIATRYLQAMRIYVGPLASFVEARKKLYRAGRTTEDYQFTCKKRGTHLVIDQVPSVTLSELTDFSFDETAKDSVKRFRDAEKRIKALSEDERRELFERLRKEI